MIDRSVDRWIDRLWTDRSLQWQIQWQWLLVCPALSRYSTASLPAVDTDIVFGPTPYLIWPAGNSRGSPHLFGTSTVEVSERQSSSFMLNELSISSFLLLAR
eukprot:scaffold29131_cov130-Amphora_coffeaeformis.AAC.1